jgi:hypothetical protein
MIILNISEYRDCSEQKYLANSKNITARIRVSVKNWIWYDLRFSWQWV